MDLHGWHPGHGLTQGVKTYIFYNAPRLLIVDYGSSMVKIISLKPKNSYRYYEKY